MRSLHPADAVHKGFGTIPTSILQRKNGVCIYERPACQFCLGAILTGSVYPKSAFLLSPP